jgi:hypothetical protein
MEQVWWCTPKNKMSLLQNHKNHVQPDHGANNLGLEDPSYLIKPECQKGNPTPLPDTHNAGWMDGEYPWVLQTRSST